jgi:UPF0755 protein
MKQKITLFLLLLLAGLAVGSWRTKSWWEGAIAPIAPTQAATNQSAKSVMVEIKRGSSAQAIGQTLVQKGLIRDADAWQWWTRLQGWQKVPGGFQAGTYDLSPSANMAEIAQTIWQGKIATRKFMIPEGWSQREMAEYFQQEGMFAANEFLQAVQQVPYQKYPWLPPNLPHLEGFLYPDTYQLGAVEKPTPQQIVYQMLDRFQEMALPVYQQQQGKTNLSLLQWATLGSIVEREAVVPQERRLIAGVFTNRLRQGMPLGSDPTVEYGLGIRQTKERNLTYAQVDQPTPYNTYINPGLPPTPIASAGVESLKATLQPEATEYLYFMARYDGTHIFTKTLGDHESARDQIRDKVDAETQATKDTKKPASN